MKSLACVGLLVFLSAAACSRAGTLEAVAATRPAAATAEATSAVETAIATRSLTQESVTRPEKTIDFNRTEKALTRKNLPTFTPTATPTPLSAPPVAIPSDDKFYNDLLNQGFKPIYGTSTSGPGGYRYSVYIFVDGTFNNFFPPEDHRSSINEFPPLYRREDRETPGCRLAFYRSDPQGSVFLYSFEAPQYPQGSNYAGYPVGCEPNVWLHPRWWYYTWDVSQTVATLGINGAWSDINQNGLPEFSVTYQYCSNACLNWGAVAIHFYEIQTTSKVVDLTANLPGVFDGNRFIHSLDPLEFYLYDPSLQLCYKWCGIDTWWIYAWDGEALVDVSSKYQDEYLAEGQELIETIQKDYGYEIPIHRLLAVLFHYEKAGLRKLALEKFLEVSDPSHWHGDTLYYCGLELARANAQYNYSHNQRYKPPVYFWGFEGDIIYRFRFDKIFSEPQYDPDVYDLSHCEILLATYTPEPWPK